MSGRPETDAESFDTAHFRVLDYYFQIRWCDLAAGECVRGVLGNFEVSPEPLDLRNPRTPNVPPVYTVALIEPTSEFGWRLGYGEAPLLEHATFENTMRHLFWRINTETARLTGSYLLVHAGAVMTPSGDGVVLAGRSGAGKTTAVAGLVRSGFGYLSDEAAAIDPVSRRLFPFPKALTLKKGSFGLFPEVSQASGSVLLGDEWLFPSSSLRAGSAAGPGPARWIILIRYSAAASTELSELTPARAVLELGQHTMNLRHYGARALPLLADVASGAKSYRLVTGDLSAAVTTLAELTARGSRMPAARTG